MGTRNLICVCYNGRFVVAQYGQYDGYPGGQGIAVVGFLRRPGNLQRLKDGLQHTYEAADKEADEAHLQIDHLRGLERVAWRAFLEFKGQMLTQEIMDYLTPSLHPLTGAGILDIITYASEEKKVPIKLDLPLPAGWPHEWLYVIDLDGAVLEVFNGCVQRGNRGHRFKDVAEGDGLPACIFSFPFSELEKMEDENEFLERLNEALRKRSDAV